jgi:hypothetical protein
MWDNVAVRMVGSKVGRAIVLSQAKCFSYFKFEMGAYVIRSV